MEKVKKFIVLPLGLFIVNLILSLHRNPWGFLNNLRLDFWQKTGYFLLNLSGSAAFILLIALLFLFVYTKRNPAELFKKSVLKALGIVFGAELILKLLFTNVLIPLLNRPAIEAAKSGTRVNDWYAVIVNCLPTTILGFGVIYFTLRLLIKSLNLNFSFHKTAFFLIFFIYLAIPTLENFALLQFINHLYVSNDATFQTVRVFNLTVGWNVFNAVWTVVSRAIITLQDAIIFVFMYRCTKQNQLESV